MTETRGSAQIDRSDPPEINDLPAMIAMIDYLVPQCRDVSPVTTVLLALARRELLSLQLANDGVIRAMARRSA